LKFGKEAELMYSYGDKYVKGAKVLIIDDKSKDYFYVILNGCDATEVKSCHLKPL
jgi:hypothetical protein